MSPTEEVGCVSPCYTMFTTFKRSMSTLAPCPCLTYIVPFSTSTTVPIFMRKSKPNKRSYVFISTTKNTILQTTLPTRTCMSSSLPKAMVTILYIVLYVSCPKTKCMIPSFRTILAAITDIDALVSTSPSIIPLLISAGKCMVLPL